MKPVLWLLFWVFEYVFKSNTSMEYDPWRECHTCYIWDDEIILKSADLRIRFEREHNDFWSLMRMIAGQRIRIKRTFAQPKKMQRDANIKDKCRDWMQRLRMDQKHQTRVYIEPTMTQNNSLSVEEGVMWICHL